MLLRLKALIQKEFVQMRRDRLTLAMMLLLPLVQLALFGFAINTDIKKVPAAVLDRSQSAQSRELLDRGHHCVVTGSTLVKRPCVYEYDRT